MQILGPFTINFSYNSQRQEIIIQFYHWNEIVFISAANRINENSNKEHFIGNVPHRNCDTISVATATTQMIFDFFFSVQVMWESTIQAFSFLLFIQCRVLHFSLTISVCITSLYYLVWILQFLHWRYNDQTYSEKMRSLEEWKRYNFFFFTTMWAREKKIAFKTSHSEKRYEMRKKE